MKRIRLFILFLLCVLCMSGGMVRKTEAASSYNLLKKVSAKATPPGKWVKNRKGYRYYYTNTGKYAKNTWLAIKGKVYYFNKAGYRATGMKKYKGSRYYLAARGALHLGWKTIGEKTYYFATFSGAAFTGWKKIGQHRYYFNDKGVIQRSAWIGDYYVGADGAMVRNTTVDGYYIDEDGRRTLVPLEEGDNPGQENSQYIFVGDSRTVGMQGAVGRDHVYIGKVGEGYQWLTTEAKKALKKALKAAPQAKVILNLGVNDLGNISNYIAYYQQLLLQYPQAKFYFLSVNPIETKLAKAKGYDTKTVSNAKIAAFNAEIQRAFPGAYLDCYTWLMEQKMIQNVKAGAGTVDGIHYTSAVYRAIHDFVLGHTQ